MKKLSKFARLVSLLALGASAPVVFGLTTTQAYIDSYHGRNDIPVPVKIVAPAADSSQAGDKVEVEFLVDAAGSPRDIRIVSATDNRFGRSVREAVEHWKFAPAKANGVAVPMKVMLPVLVRDSE